MAGYLLLWVFFVLTAPDENCFVCFAFEKEKNWMVNGNTELEVYM